MADPRDDDREFGDDGVVLPADDIGLDQLDEDDDEAEDEDGEGGDADADDE